ncbi:substrate-binding periplasmic protein [Kiloniella sp.]|uniref:substrate-binding periplasmic protein n=1 Tax=Kiloniella sp. TaxID=1938587 RepID=UPI003B01A7DA
MRLKRLFSIVCIFSVANLTPLQSLADQDVVIIGDDGYAPFSYVEDNQPKGIYVRILRDVFSQLEGYKVNLKMLPWKRGLRQIETGKDFAIFPPYYWPEKRPYIATYSEPLLLEQVVAICHKKVLEKARDNWPTDYKGLKIGTNDGFLTPGPAFFQAVKEKKISLIESTNTRKGLRMLLGRRTDCYVNAEMSIRWGLLRLRRAGLYDLGLDQLRFGAVVDAKWAYIGFTAVNEGAYPYREDFIKKINNVIRKMRETGAINRIVEGFFEY